MAEPAPLDTAEPEKGTRERSTIRFPYVDLDSAVEVPKKMIEQTGTAPCTFDQLAAWLNYESFDSGTFRNRLAAARHFGFVRVTRPDKVALTALGKEIVEPHKERGARVKAFLSVPLFKKVFETYRGRLLPPDVGLEHEMKAFGVAMKQTDRARQVLRRSAEQAGFFTQGRDRLVQPAGVEPTDGQATGAEDSAGNGRGAIGSGGAPPSGVHPKIRMLLTALPPSGQVWPADDQEVWLDILRGVFTQIYQAEAEVTEPES